MRAAAEMDHGFLRYGPEDFRSISTGLMTMRSVALSGCSTRSIISRAAVRAILLALGSMEVSVMVPIEEKRYCQN